MFVDEVIQTLFDPTGPDLHHLTQKNLKLDPASYAARVIRETYHAGGVTVWLGCPIRHTTALPQPTLPWTDTLLAAPSLVAQEPLCSSQYGSQGPNLSILLLQLVKKHRPAAVNH